MKSVRCLMLGSIPSLSGLSVHPKEERSNLKASSSIAYNELSLLLKEQKASSLLPRRRITYGLRIPARKFHFRLPERTGVANQLTSVHRLRSIPSCREGSM